MAWYTNQFGYEVFLGREDLSRIEGRGDMRLFQPRAIRHEGEGPSNRIAILFASHNGSNGIGDYVHAMPALTAKVQAGFECHVYTTEFFCPFIERCGAIYHDAMQLGFGSLIELKQEYGAVLSLVHWCIQHDEATFGNVTKTRFEQIAELLEVELPESYSWRESIGPANRIQVALCLALRSTGKPRSYELPRDMAEITKLTERHNLVLFEVGGGNAHKEPWMQEARNLSELIEWICGCRVVVATDNGILALALALEIPCVAVFGPTDENTIVWQFSRYVQTQNVRVIRSQKPDPICSRPCSLQKERGFEVPLANGKLKCKWHGSDEGMSDCLAEITPAQIAQEISTLLESIH